MWLTWDDIDNSSSIIRPISLTFCTISISDSQTLMDFKLIEYPYRSHCTRVKFYYLECYSVAISLGFHITMWLFFAGCKHENIYTEVIVRDVLLSGMLFCCNPLRILYHHRTLPYSRYPKNFIKICSNPEPDFVPMDGKMELCMVMGVDPFRNLSLFVKAETFHDCSCYSIVPDIAIMASIYPFVLMILCYELAQWLETEKKC